MSILYLVFLGCVLVTDGLQPQHGSYIYRDEEDSTSTTSSNCKDLMNKVRCRWGKSRIGCSDAKMHRYCPQTCHLCHLRNKAPAPPRNLNCKETTYGCCWDGVTTQHNYEGEGCPPCEDEKVFAALCGMWERHCHNSSRPVEHQVVRKHCHRTCNNCFAVKSTEKPKVQRTLPTVHGIFVNSDDSPRRGAIYVWSKLVNPFKFKEYGGQ